MSSNKLDKNGLTYLWSKIVAYMNNVFPRIGDTVMGTVATTITGAIKEHNDKIGNSTMGTTATTLTGAIAEHESDISALNSNINQDISLLSAYCNTKYIGYVTKLGKLKIIYVCFDSKAISSVNTWTTIGTIPEGYRAISNGKKEISRVSRTGVIFDASVDSSGNIKICPRSNTISNGDIITFDIVYI